MIIKKSKLRGAPVLQARSRADHRGDPDAEFWICGATSCVDSALRRFRCRCGAKESSYAADFS
jgi:hypothetical protein